MRKSKKKIAILLELYVVVALAFRFYADYTFAGVECELNRQLQWNYVVYLG